MEFDNHRFLWEPMNDMSPFQAWLKPPQIGASEGLIIKTLYCAKKKNWDIIYTLPTASDVNDMAGGKINRIIAQNPILQEWVKDHDTVDQKYVGNHIINYRGTFSQKQAMMVSSNLNVHDEIDASNPDVITQYETRQQANAEMRTWVFSHPSLAGFGVDIHYQQSDKKEWFVTCSSCTAEQVLSFPDNIDPVKKTRICAHCKEELSREDIIGGIWKPTSGICRYDPFTGEDLYKGLEKTSDGKELRKYSGYHISQLMCVWIPASKILDDYASKDAQYFNNMVLGLPYVGSDAKINEQDFFKNVVNVTNSQEGRIIIGVDTGLPIWYTLMNKEGVFFHGSCENYNRLRQLLNKYPNSILVSDQGGDLIGIRQLQQEYRGRVFLCYYRKDRKTQEIIRWGKDEEFGTVMVDRNRMIQMIVDQIKDGGRITFNGTHEDWKPLAQHFSNIYRTTVETPYGAVHEWQRNGPDHLVHALLYGLVGYDKYKENLATIIGGNDFLSGIKEGRIFHD